MVTDLVIRIMPDFMIHSGAPATIATAFMIHFTSDILTPTPRGDGTLAGVTAGVDIMVTATDTPHTILTADIITTTVLITHVKWLIMQGAETAILIATGIPKPQKAVFPEYRDIPTPVT